MPIPRLRAFGAITIGAGLYTVWATFIPRAASRASGPEEAQ